MSLLVWLPLNGNLNNQGLSDLVFTNNNTSTLTTNSSGKIGSCYQRATAKTAGHISSNKTINLNNDFSITCWAYVTQCVGSTANGLITFHSHADNTGSGINIKQISDSDYRVCCNTGTGSGRTFDTYYGTTNIKNAWHLLGLTYNKTTKVLQLWVDGKVEYTLNNYINASKEDYIRLFEWSTTFDSIEYRPAAKLNDVRVYDHTLSTKEMKEISKGLLVHYKLSGVASPNLITSMSAGGRTSVINNYSLLANFGQNADTYGYFNVSPALVLDKTYTLSFDVKDLPSGSSWEWQLWNNINYTFTVNKNGHHKFTFIPTASKLPSGYSLSKFLFDDGLRTNPSGNVTFYNFKIEEGNKDTPWIPHSTDTVHSSLGLNKSIEYDCSGYKYHGTKNGTIVNNSNTSKYYSSSTFDGSDNSILIGNLSTMVPEGNFTMNCWIYKDGTWSSKSYETIFGGPSGFELEAKSSSTNSPLLVAYSWGGSSVSYELNKWNMITMVRTSTATKFYLNGNLVITGTAGNFQSGNYYVGAWRSATEQNYKGNISDFRIYCTALSDNDIKELYQTSASVDKSGNIYALEFKEE